MPAGSPEPSDDEVGVAVIGAGYWGPNLIRNFLACNDTWLWAVCDLDEARAQRVLGRYTSVRTTSDLDDVLNDRHIDAVAIATPVASHHPIAMAALNAGKHVLIEKPLASTLSEAKELVATAEAKDLILMCDHTFCYTAAVNRIRDEVQGGSLGEIQYIDSVRINFGIVQRDSDVFWDLLPHDVSVFDSVLPGGFEPVAVSALGVDPIGAGHVCVGYVTMTLPNEAIAHVHVSWLSPLKIRTLVIGGSKRHLVWDDTNPAQRISMYERGVDIDRLESSEAIRDKMWQYRIGDMLAPALDESEALQNVVREFARSVRDHTTPLTDGHAGLRVLRVLEAAHSSLRRGGALVPLAEAAP